MSWWTRVWWQAPPLWSVLSKHLIPRSGNQPEELVCTSLLRSFLPAGPLKQPRQRYNKHSTTFQLLLSIFWRANSFFCLKSNHFTWQGARMFLTVGRVAPAFNEPAYLSGTCYVTSWWSSATGGNSYLQTGPASLAGWLHSHHWTDNWRNPEGWWFLHVK